MANKEEPWIVGISQVDTLFADMDATDEAVLISLGGLSAPKDMLAAVGLCAMVVTAAIGLLMVIQA